MPLYLLRFKVNTCLTANQDLTVDFRENSPVFLFSKKRASDDCVIAQLNLEAKNNREAWGQAAESLLPPILDALSFATGTPLLLRDCELILKDEAGDASRKALHIGHRHTPVNVPLRNEQVIEMKQILARAEGVALPLCWHRYALDRQLALEQFVFNWLGFEALAGDADVPTRCSKCQTELEHCDTPVTHRGSDRTAAREIFQAAHPEVSNKEFNTNIWGKARNSVFHGRRYPEPKYLVELNSISEKVHAAMDKQAARLLGLQVDNRPHHRYETFYRHFLFIEWRTASLAEPFAPDWPESHLVAMAAEESPGEAHYAASAAGITFLNYEQDSADW